MDSHPKAKKSKIQIKNLTALCDWDKPTGIAIKYHEDVKISKDISYEELADAKLSIEKMLRDAKTSLFIGIAHETPSFCLPGLMLGIMGSKRAFVCLPESAVESKKIREKLEISHIYSPDNIQEHELIFDFRMHWKKLYFLKRKNVLMDFSSIEKNFAYAMTTSGSTGEPKIVRVTHNSIVPNIVDLKRILEISENDTIAQLTPVTFDPSIIEIFISLYCNCTLLMVSQELKNDPMRLLTIINDSRVSVLQSTPSLLLHRWSSEDLRNTILGENSYLRILLLGGEHFPSSEVLTRIKATENKTKIFDIYGITEVSCWATIREILNHDSKRFLGETLSETILEVRDETGKVVKEGEGILHIGSDSRICVIDEEIVGSNVTIFRNTGDIVSIDQKGLMTLRGRNGRRVKRYGTKLNLTELENHVTQLPIVENSYALFTENNQSLHLFFTTFNKSFNESDKISHEMNVLSHTSKMSSIYRPNKVSLLSRFKLNSNGKICRNYLKNVTTKMRKFSSQSIDDCEIFTEIWKRLIPSREESGFLDSGGTSVMALQIASELTEKSGHDYPEIIGRLLRNENLISCREYVSKKVSDSTTMKGDESLINDSISESTNRGENFAESLGHPTENDENFIWQKCRGRNNFPNRIEAEDTNNWINIKEIRVLQKYLLGKCVDASPTVFTYPESQNFVTVGSHSGIICTAELSKEKTPNNWEIKLPDRIEASLLVLNDFRAIVGCYDSHVYCLHLKSGEIYWKFKTGDTVKSTAIICSRNRTIFFGSYDRYVYSVSVENGFLVWKTKISDGSISATPYIDSQLKNVLFASLDGTCASLSQINGEIIWKNKLRYPVFSAPTILTNGIAVFCDVSGSLNGFATSTGEKMWSLEINAAVFSHLLVNTDPITQLQSILFTSKNQNIYKFDCSSIKHPPKLGFKENVGFPMFATPATNGKVIVVIGTGGELKILDFASGASMKSFKCNGDVFSSPIIHDDYIVVGCRDNYLYVMECLSKESR